MTANIKTNKLMAEMNVSLFFLFQNNTPSNFNPFVLLGTKVL